MKIIIIGNPEPKARHRSFIRGKHIVSYDPQDASKKLFAFKLKQYKIKEPSNTFSVRTDYFIKVPDSYCESKRNKCLWGIIRPRNNDTDNLVKYTWDAANTILWPDDRMIDDMSASKRYSDNPRTEITTENDMIDENSEVAEVLALCSPDQWQMLCKDVNKIALYFYMKESISSPPAMKEVAFLLGKLAANHSKMLGKIAKKFPDYEKFEKVSGEGKTLC